MSASVLIAGLGYIGSEVAKSLLLKNFSVVGLTRTSQSAERVRIEGIDARAINLCSPEELRSIPACDAVVFCAAASSHDEQTYREVYLYGLQNLLTTIHAWPVVPKQLIFTSSTGVYHQQDGSVVNEDSPTAPVNFTGQIMLAAEELIRTSGITYQILRLSGIYGPGRDRIIRQVREGKWEAAITDEYQNRIYRDDAVAAIVAMLRQESSSSTFIVSDMQPTLKSTVIEYVSQELKKNGELIPALPSLIEQPALNKRCSSLKLQSSGFRFKCPSFRDGIKELLNK